MLKKDFFTKIKAFSMPQKEAKSENNFHISLHFLNNSHDSNSDYSSLADEAYSKNVIVYRAINLIANSAASVPWKLHMKKNDKKHEIHDHAILDLLHRPNPICSGASFFQNLYAYKLISGNSFIYSIVRGKTPFELHLLRPDRVKVEPGNAGIPKFYKYQIGEKEVKISVDKLSGKSDILHIKSFNPLDDYLGMSSLSSAAFSIDQHNESSKWNLAMLKNAARPSGALIMKSGSMDQDFLTKEQFDAVKEQLSEVYCSSNNTGRPILLQGGLEWQELSLSPKDMDFIEAKHSSARDIALSFGVPPQLLGIPGDNTYSNMQEARLALWEETILPLLDHVTDALNNWLVPMFDSNLVLYYDIDEISALGARREKLWSRIENATFLTINEKRKFVGLSPIEGKDELNDSSSRGTFLDLV